MTYIRKLLFICCSLFLSNTVYAECTDTPAEHKARDEVSIFCTSQENNLGLMIYTSTMGTVYTAIFPVPLISCDPHNDATSAPSKVFNGKTVRMHQMCAKTSSDTTFIFDAPITKAGFDYIKKQLLRNKPLIVTSPNKDNPFKATFDTHKYREMILDAFNTNDGIYGGM